MADQTNAPQEKKSTEIVTEQELSSTLSKLDVDTFLKLYNEWKVTHDTSVFAALRSMHENAGYNNKNVIFGAEKEMHEIATIVQRYKDGRVTVTQSTATATATARPSGTIESVLTPSQIEEERQKLREKMKDFTPDSLETSVKWMEWSINTLVPNSVNKPVIR